MTKKFLVLNTGMVNIEVYECDTLTEVAKLVCGEKTPEDAFDEISWQLRRTGRYDREDGVIIVIESKPSE